MEWPVYIAFIVFAICLFSALFSMQPESEEQRQKPEQQRKDEEREREQQRRQLELQRQLKITLRIWTGRITGEWLVEKLGVTVEELVFLEDGTYIWIHGPEREVRKGAFSMTGAEDNIGTLRLLDEGGTSVEAEVKFIPEDRMLLSVPGKNELFTKKA
jgi:hypothetical protein